MKLVLDATLDANHYVDTCIDDTITITVGRQEHQLSRVSKKRICAERR